jgi:hypothetical protein
MFQNSGFMFCKNFASNFLSSGKFSTTLKLDSEKSLEPLVGLWGKNLEEKHQQAPILLREGWSTSSQSIMHAQSISHFHFAAKSTLRIKLQRWFFSYGVHESLSLRNIKKLVKFILVFNCWLLFAKNRFSHNFASGSWKQHEQLSLIWKIKSKRPLTQLPVIKV